ncbi:MAG TPA: aminomethyl-transferring glycine dehydrogenase subunit GcvPA [Clostridia bacterium]|nr:aminomethyl-transferring glycine dehydrogenase subunit GcvPA [Clostridia bacterium]
MANYLSNTNEERKQMLEVIGAKSVNDLFCDISSTLRAKPLCLPDGLSQQEVFDIMKDYAEQNKVYKKIFRGAGSYFHYIPSVVKNLSSRSEFLTAYTPYQAEMSQGILQSIFEYQSYICRLTGMDVSNASHYSGATAAVEALLMYADKKRNTAVVFDNVHPDTIEVIKTYLSRREMVVEIVRTENGIVNADILSNSLNDNVCAVYLEQPNFFGLLENLEVIADKVHGVGAKIVAGFNPIALGLLKTPFECGVDIAVGEAQPLGLPMNFGGPYLGFMACTAKDMRKIPGRIVGQTVDADGHTAYVLTLQAREQHIRREKATSNICSNEAHCALTASIYLSSMGAKGLKEVAVNCLSNAHYLARELEKVDGISLKFGGEFFHEFVTLAVGKSKAILSALDYEGILGGLALSDDEILWCATEMCKKEDMDKVVEVVKGAVL